MALVQSSNLLLRFLLELAALAALGYWGFRLPAPLPVRVALGLGAPIVAAVVWAIFVSPNAAVAVPTWLWLALQGLVFGTAAAGLVASGHARVAGVFGATVLLNGLLMWAWAQ
jgi:hypothetical protein